ncbi:hypothetical protein [Salinibaculum rarum]|uniref:hypothetical protein n=1 Tax=Salinibaculum rarum TaxID=3058903 RepID=UPI00265E730E|nr:hypothetical protein [Salinibaculum sp. KK48]
MGATDSPYFDLTDPTDPQHDKTTFALHPEFEPNRPFRAQLIKAEVKDYFDDVRNAFSEDDPAALSPVARQMTHALIATLLDADYGAEQATLDDLAHAVRTFGKDGDHPQTSRRDAEYLLQYQANAHIAHPDSKVVKPRVTTAEAILRGIEAVKKEPESN